MRDIIWTIIGIWLLWRIIDAFRSYSSAAKKVQNDRSNHHHNTSQHHTQNPPPKKGELKSDAGEYVDYEDVK